MDFKIPLFNLNYGQEELDAVTETINSKWISTGPKCVELEEMFAKVLGAKYAVSVASCTAALHLSCILCGFGPGDEVICPSLTFAASVNCIRYVGATPVFCDITGTNNMNINPACIEKLITPKTKGIVVVHMAGFPADMDAIMAIAKKHNLKVVEDACHGPLSEYKGKKLGTIGDVSSFSFFSNKNISTGEGGILVTNNEEFAIRAKLLRSHGMTTMSYQRASGHATSYDIVELGYNYRLDDIHACLAIAQLKKLRGDLEKRIHVRDLYVKLLSEIPNVTVPFADNKEFVSNYICPVVLENSTKEKRDRIRDYIHAQGVQTSVHYPPIHKFSIYKDFTCSLPVTEYVTDNELTLPMYAALTDEQIKFIVKTLKDALENDK